MVLMLIIQSISQYKAQVFYGDASIQLLKIIDKQGFEISLNQLGAILANIPAWIASFLHCDFDWIAQSYAAGTWIIVGSIIYILHVSQKTTLAFAVMFSSISFMREGFLFGNEIYVSMALSALTSLYFTQVRVHGMRAWIYWKTWLGLIAYYLAITCHIYSVIWIPFLILLYNNRDVFNIRSVAMQLLPLLFFVFLIEGFSDSKPGHMFVSRPYNIHWQLSAVWASWIKEHVVVLGIVMYWGWISFKKLRPTYLNGSYISIGILIILLVIGSVFYVQELTSEVPIENQALLFVFPISLVISESIAKIRFKLSGYISIIWVLSLWCLSLTLNSIEPYTKRFSRLEWNWNRLAKQSGAQGGYYYVKPGQYESVEWRSVWALPYETTLLSYYNNEKNITLISVLSEQDTSLNLSNKSLDSLLIHSSSALNIKMKNTKSTGNQWVNISLY